MHMDLLFEYSVRDPVHVWFIPQIMKIVEAIIYSRNQPVSGAATEVEAWSGIVCVTNLVTWKRGSAFDFFNGQGVGVTLGIRAHTTSSMPVVRSQSHRRGREDEANELCGRYYGTS
eukprot:COSAG02_NODE_1699_length_11254_cov_13.904169_5_plen_116_part_00